MNPASLSAAPLAVTCRGADSTLAFAAEELVRYLGLMAGDTAVAIAAETSEAAGEGMLEVGLFGDFGLSPFPDLDPYWDDAIVIEVSGSRGRIAGLNPRSALHAVYRFLEAAGCRWLRPGKDGEWIPRRPIDDLSIRITEKPSFRYRGHSHCGGYHEAVMEKIDWMAKVGLNVLFEEFFPPNCRSGYHLRRYPSLLPVEELPREIHEANFQKELAAMKKRGILFQSVGHGWSGPLYGLYQVSAPEDRAEFFRRASAKPEYLAEVKGERRPHRRGGALYTELCYGNPEVREKLVDVVIRYAVEHPEVDVLHFSMSDAMNLMCECPLCRDVAPSDFLVMLLNAIDGELTARDLHLRVGFFLYQEVWWPPVAEAIRNPSRFLIYFCPIARSYQEPYEVDAPVSALPPYVYNASDRISDMAGLIASLKLWQEKVPSECVGFEYHLTWYHYFDPGQFRLARLMGEDIRRMPQLGLQGFVSCQVVQASFPTGFLLALHARCLWAAETEVDAFAQAYFHDALGADGAQCADYLDALSQHFRPENFYRYFPLPETPRDDEAIASVSAIPGIVEAFRPVIERNLQESTDAVHRAGWRILLSHAQLVLLLAGATRAKLEGRQEVVDAYWDQILDFILINEKRLTHVFDCQWFYEAWLRRANLFSPGFASTGGFEKRDVLNVSAQLQDPRD